MILLYKVKTYHANNFCGGSNDAVASGTSQSLQFNNEVLLVQHSSVAEYYTHGECNHSGKINLMTISRCCNIILLKDGGHNLENAGCDLAPVWRIQAVTWLLSGGCRL